jgi:hypothetical protein
MARSETTSRAIPFSSPSSHRPRRRSSRSLIPRRWRGSPAYSESSLLPRNRRMNLTSMIHMARALSDEMKQGVLNGVITMVELQNCTALLGQKYMIPTWVSTNIRYYDRVSDTSYQPSKAGRVPLHFQRESSSVPLLPLFYYFLFSQNRVIKKRHRRLLLTQNLLRTIHQPRRDDLQRQHRP